MRISEQIVLSGCKERTYAGHATRAEVDDSEVGKARLREDNAGDYKHARRDKSTDRVGENVLEHDSSVAGTESSCNKNVFLVLEAVELHSRSSRHSRPSRQEEGNEQNYNVADIKVILQKRDNDHKGNRSKKVNDSLHDKVDLTAVVALDRAVDSTDEEVYGCNDDSENE